MGSEEKQFWTSASNGLVQFGHGSVIGEQTILSWQDPNPHEAVFVGVMTGWGSTGTWNVCMEDDATEPESTCLTASTADNKEYDTIFSQELGSSKALSEVYEIVIGGWGNSKSVIRKSNQGTNQVQASTSNIVSSSEEKQFWASASNGLVQFGHGS